MVGALGMLAAGGAAGVLLYASAAKLASPRDFRRTLRQLNLPSVERVWFLVPLVEVGCGALLVFRPHLLATAVAVAVLGLAFASAGAYAHLRHLAIRCACFGQGSSGRLGRKQVLLLPVWWGLAALVWFGAPVYPIDAPVVAAVVAAGALGVAFISFVPLAREARGYLLTAVES